MKTKSKLGRLEQRKLQIVEAIDYTKKLKGSIQEYSEKLERSYKTGKISYLDYKKAHKNVFKGRSVEQWLKYYDQCIDEYQRQLKKCDKVDRKFEYGKLFTVLAMALVVVSLIGVGGFTGYTILSDTATVDAPVDDTFTIENVTVDTPIEDSGAESNETAADIPIEQTVQHEARVGQPVTWTKVVVSNEASGIVVELPSTAKVVRVSEFENDVEKEISKDKYKIKKPTKVAKGEIATLDERSSEDNVTIEVTENVSELAIEYTTEAPTLSEEETEFGKRVNVSSETHYENIITNVSIEPAEESSIKLYRIVDGERVEHDFTAIDNDEDGLVDEIEWITPHLSSEVFEIIIITRAQHLDASRNVISDIYDEVREQDDVWSETINEGEYVRITFEQNLTSDKDITLYPRTVSGSPRVEVYAENSTTMVAEFETLVDNDFNQVFLNGLEGEEDTFDLRVAEGAIELDYIVDPSFEVNNVSNDMEIVPVSNGGSFLVVRQTGTRNASLFQAYYANGSNLTTEVIINANSRSPETRVSAVRMDPGYFVISTIDGAVDSDVVLRGYYLNGSLASGFTPVTVDSDVNIYADIDVCAFNQTTYMSAFMDNNDNDATFAIYANSTQVIGQTDIDTAAAPDAGCYGQDCVACATFNQTAALFAYFDDTSTDQIAYSLVTAGGNEWKAEAQVDASSADGAVDAARLGHLASTNDYGSGGDHVVLAYCDSTDDDVSFVIYAGNGSARTGIVDVNQSINDCSGAAGTHVAVAALNTTDGQFVIAYDNTIDDTIYFAVYNASGTPILPTPGTMSSTRLAKSSSTTNKAIALASFDSVHNISVCNQLSNITFIAGFNLANGSSTWTQMYVNGSLWNGDCELQNRNPEVNGLILNSTNSAQTNYTNETLSASFTCTDSDTSDTLTYDIYFIKNGGYDDYYLHQSCSGYTKVLLQHENTTRGDLWSFKVNVTDSRGGISSTIESNVLTIRNAAPNIDSFLLNSTDAGNNSNGTAKITYSYTDVDGDSVTPIIDWFIDGALNNTFGNSTNITAGNFTDLGYNITAIFRLKDSTTISGNYTGSLYIANNNYSNCSAINGNLTVSTKVNYGAPMLTCKYIRVLNGGTLTLNSSQAGDTVVNVSALNIWIDSGAVMTSSRTGYRRDLGPGTPPGASGDQGAGHGGYGGDSSGGNGGLPYGSVEYPMTMGSGGDAGADGQGIGGGAIYINASVLRVDGMLDSNASVTSEGGGAGGSLLINVTTLEGTGLISASGGGSKTAGDAGGSGGRIAIYYNTWTYTGFVNATGGVGSSTALSSNGAAGTIFKKDKTGTNAPLGELIINNADLVQSAVTELNSTFMTTQTISVLNVTGKARLSLNTTMNVTSTDFIIPAGTEFLQNANFTMNDLQNMTISGSLMLSNNYTFKDTASWTLNSGANITHKNNSNEDIYRINITANNFNIKSGAFIDVICKGYQSGSGTGKGTAATGAGGYGGIGGGAGGGGSYGSITNPTDLGSGGNGAAAALGCGSGAVILNVTNTLTVDGIINASGIYSTANAPGGSGGSINLKSATFAGSGTIAAYGGETTSTSTNGGGAGGRIAVYYNTITFNGDINAYGKGAKASQNAQRGAAGTVFIKDYDDTYGSLTINQNKINTTKYTIINSSFLDTNTINLTVANGSEVEIDKGLIIKNSLFELNEYNYLEFLGNVTMPELDNMTINSSLLLSNFSSKGTASWRLLSSGNLSHLNNSDVDLYRINITAKNFTIDQNAQINVLGKGYQCNYGPGTGTGTNGGGGYGGYGGEDGGIPYGSITNPTDLGSGAKVGTCYNYMSGAGAILLIVNDTFENNGIINASSEISSYASGSGGTINIRTEKMKGNGIIIASSGNALSAAGYGSGSGGRIAIYYTTNSYTGEIRAYANTAGTAGELYKGAAGTVYMKAADQTYGELFIENNQTVGNKFTLINSSFMNLQGLDKLVITNGSKVKVEIPLEIRNVNFEIGTYSTLEQTGNLTMPYLSNMTINGTVIFTNTIFNSTAIWRLLSSGNLSHYSNYDTKTYIINITAINFTMDSGSQIDLRKVGYAGSKGSGVGTGFGGGSYGGYGGATAGRVYGSMTSPDELGSGGYSETEGGQGGGAIFINATDTLDINGTITVNSSTASTVATGSAGSIWLVTNKFKGTGNLWAQSGTPPGTRGVGSGGRIAVYSLIDEFKGEISTKGLAGSSSTYDGDNGTIFRMNYMEGTQIEYYNTTVIMINNGITVRSDYNLNISESVNKTMNVTWGVTSVNWTEQEESKDGGMNATYNIQGLTPSTTYKLYDNGTIIKTLETDGSGVLPTLSTDITGIHDFVLMPSAADTIIGVQLTDSQIMFGSGYYDSTCDSGYATIMSNTTKTCWIDTAGFPAANDTLTITNNGTVAANITASIEGIANAEEIFCGAGGCTQTANANITMYTLDDEAGSCIGLATESSIADHNGVYTTKACNSLSASESSNSIKAFINLFIPKDTTSGEKQIVIVYTAVAA